MTSDEPGREDVRHTHYRRVADELRAKINSGAYGPGDKLPTQIELAEESRVSRPTVVEAINLLRRDGLIVTRRGQGMFVAPDPSAASSASAASAPSAASAASGTSGSAGASTGSSKGQSEGEAEGENFVSEMVPSVRLQPYIKEAFEAQEVTLDVFSMTTESLAKRVSDQKDLILDKINKPPQSIRARLMLPDTDSPFLSIPRPTDEAADEEERIKIRNRLGGILRSHASMLRESLFELQRRGAVAEVEVKIRLVPFSPQMKLYIINKHLVLQAPYVVQENAVFLSRDAANVPIFDSYGTTGSPLYPYRSSLDSAGAGAAEADGIVQQYQAFFDSNWKHLAKKANF